MAKNNNQNTVPARSKGNFILENQKSLGFILGGVVVLILLYFGYQRFYLAPRAEAAQDQMYKAENYALVDSLRQRAIDGDGAFPGFKEIAEAYDNTPSANIANAYLGGLYLREGKFQEAIAALEKYSNTGSQILDPLVIGMLGDAHSELKDYKKAASYYKKAADRSPNSFTTPLMLKKLGLVHEAQHEFKPAIDAYKRIKAEYPESAEGATVDGLITRAEARL